MQQTQNWYSGPAFWSSCNRSRYHLPVSRFFNSDSTSLTLFEFSLLTSESFSSEDFRKEIWESWAWFRLPEIIFRWFDALAVGECVCLLNLAFKADIDERKASSSTLLNWSAGIKMILSQNEHRIPICAFNYVSFPKRKPINNFGIFVAVVC